MKGKFILFAAAALSLAACNKALNEGPKRPAETGTLTISFKLPDDQPATKGDINGGTGSVTAYTATQTYETQINKVRVLVFNASGVNEGYADVGTATSKTFTVSPGTKHIYAVINGADVTLDASLTETTFKQKYARLESNSKTASTGFVMAGTANASVTANTPSSCTVNVSRIASRVVVKKITNALNASYNLKVKGVFLSNVNALAYLWSKTNAGSTWYNQEGRKDESPRVENHKIEGSTYVATQPALTYAAVPSASQSLGNGASYAPAAPHVLLYAMPNSNTTASDGFHATFAAQATRLVIYGQVTINGAVEDKWWNAPFETAITANNSYTIEATINSLGSPDPNDNDSENPTGEAGLTVTISPNTAWDNGGSFAATM